MLSLGKLAHGQQAYYVDSVARGAEEYYTGAKEAPGQWVGSASGRFGLEGEVDPEALANLLAHVDPSGKFRLTGAHSVPTVAAYDVTFCVPKSVSLLFALGDPEVSNQVRNATNAAIEAALPVLEAAACRVRRGQGGHTVLEGDGFVAAAFRHRTSRAGDPHLHTHVLLANVAHCPEDEKWSALDGRPLYHWLSPVGHLHEAHLRYELTERLGVEWGPLRNGIADVAGIDREVLREFSTRRKEIEAHLEECGMDSAKAAQVAAYATRQAKDLTADPEGLLPSWRARAEALGLDATALHAVTDRTAPTSPPRPGSPAAEQLYLELASPEGLTADNSTFGQREVIKAICNALPAGGRVEDVLALVDGFLRSPHVVPVRINERAAVIARNNGKTIAARTDEHRWTTPEMLEVEQRLLAGATARRDTAAAVALPATVDEAIAATATLTGEQAGMVRSICSTGDGVEIVEGVAGAGKTFALAVARQAWEASGYRVLGCSLAARAAKQLQDDAAIPSQTIDRLLAGIERHATTLDDATVLVVDEAAMVGTRKLARLLDHAQAAGTKVVLVGDPCQLPEIEAGGTFRGLQGRLGASLLTDNRRQTNAWERAALADLRAGKPEQALDTYVAQDRVHHAGDGDLRDQLVTAWLDARLDGQDALMVAGRRVDVEDLNRRARNLLRESGLLGADHVVLGERPFAVGDDVLARRNDYRLGIFNGTRASIEELDTIRQQMTLAGTDGTRLVVPFDYAEAGHLAHGYATTVHKAQGATVDRCFILADDTLDREHAYTALSRGRHGNDLYVTTEDHRVEERHANEYFDDALATIRRGLGRSGAQHLASDQLDAAPPSRLRGLQQERDQLRRRLGDGPPDPGYGYRLAAEELARFKDHRANAIWRLERAHQDLEDLGPIGRRIRPTERRQLRERIGSFEAEIRRHDAAIERAEHKLDQLAPAALERHTWERQHRPELDRLEHLDRQIDVTLRLDAAARTPERTVERDLGISL